MMYRLRFLISTMAIKGVGVYSAGLQIQIPNTNLVHWYQLAGIGGGMGAVETDWVDICAGNPRLPVLTADKALLNYNVRLKIEGGMASSSKLLPVSFELRGLTAEESGKQLDPIVKWEGSLNCKGLSISDIEIFGTLDACMKSNPEQRFVIAY